MNVLSLPDEMLASVLKYNRFEDLTAVRKVSSKIDSVARRYGMDKLKADSLRISFGGTNVLVMIEVLHLKKIYSFAKLLSTDLLEILKYYFSKIRRVKDLHLNNFIFRKRSISNEVGKFLLGNGCKNITRLTICQWDISINYNTMRRIMTELKIKELDINASFTEFDFSDAVIEGIPFDSLRLSSEPGTAKPRLSLPYLTRLCTLKIPSILKCKIYNSTISDLITFFKVWTKETLNTVKQWVIEVSKNTMSVEETKQSLAILKCFEECEVSYSNNGNIRSFYIGLNGDYGQLKMIVHIFP